MFKVLVLQALYNLSDEQTEFMIRDRLSFMRFLALARSPHWLVAPASMSLTASTNPDWLAPSSD